MDILKTKIVSSFQSSQINQLWNEEYPIKLIDRFPILLEGVKNYNHYLVQDNKQKVLAWAVDFEKEDEIRFSILVAAEHKAQGIGSMLVDKLKAENKLFYGWVIDHNNDLKANGEYYQTPIEFYKKHGFEIMQNLRIESEMIRAVKIKWNCNE